MVSEEDVAHPKLKNCVDYVTRVVFTAVSSRTCIRTATMSDGTPPPSDPIGASTAPPASTGSPTDFLKGVVGKRVVVRLTSGVDYRGLFFENNSPLQIVLTRMFRVTVSIGILSCLDGYMNIALEQTEEHVNGKVTNRYGDAFIRGNNGQ